MQKEKNATGVLHIESFGSFVEHRIIKCQNCDFNPLIWGLNIRIIQNIIFSIESA